MLARQLLFMKDWFDQFWNSDDIGKIKNSHIVSSIWGSSGGSSSNTSGRSLAGVWHATSRKYETVPGSSGCWCRNTEMRQCASFCIRVWDTNRVVVCYTSFWRCANEASRFHELLSACEDAIVRAPGRQTKVEEDGLISEQRRIQLHQSLLQKMLQCHTRQRRRQDNPVNAVAADTYRIVSIPTKECYANFLPCKQQQPRKQQPW